MYTQLCFIQILRRIQCKALIGLKVGRGPFNRGLRLNGQTIRRADGLARRPCRPTPESFLSFTLKNKSYLYPVPSNSLHYRPTLICSVINRSHRQPLHTLLRIFIARPVYLRSHRIRLYTMLNEFTIYIKFINNFCHFISLQTG